MSRWKDWDHFHECNPQVLTFIVNECGANIAGFRNNFVILDPETPEDEAHFSIQVYDDGPDIGELLYVSSLMDE